VHRVKEGYVGMRGETKKNKRHLKKNARVTGSQYKLRSTYLSLGCPRDPSPKLFSVF
jgi:hypothetical protein